VQLAFLNDWMTMQGLPPGFMSYDFADPDTGEQRAVFDLAWPNGIQEELSQPVVVMLNEGPEAIAIASLVGRHETAEVLRIHPPAVVRDRLQSEVVHAREPGRGTTEQGGQLPAVAPGKVAPGRPNLLFNQIEGGLRWVPS
jgi:hypothetical protein